MAFSIHYLVKASNRFYENVSLCCRNCINYLLNMQLIKNCHTHNKNNQLGSSKTITKFKLKMPVW
jgi:hypothetical protein